MSAEATINQARDALEAGRGLEGTGFWKLVGDMKSDRSLQGHIDEVAAIDQVAFKNWALVIVPLWVGTTLMVLGTIAGLVLIGMTYVSDGVWAGVWLLTGTAVILVTTHGLAHLVVGRLLGIRFTHWFIGTISRPQPGVKTDYATYLRAPATSRAWMHASGAIVTKLVPFSLIGAGIAADAPSWAIWVLVVVGLAQLITDLLWSTNASDWKKFKREMQY